jgi:hypothetical protein
MSYLAFCTFDLKGASSKDYENAYADLSKMGLAKVHKSDHGTQVVIPTTAAMGTFDGSGAGAVRDHVCDRVEAAFRARRFSAEIFVVVGGDWAWGSRRI